MADQQSRGGQKTGNLDPNDPQSHRGTATGGAGQRSDADKQQDQRNNPDDANRQPTDQTR